MENKDKPLGSDRPQTTGCQDCGAACDYPECYCRDRERDDEDADLRDDWEDDDWADDWADDGEHVSSAGTTAPELDGPELG